MNLFKSSAVLTLMEMVETAFQSLQILLDLNTQELAPQFVNHLHNLVLVPQLEILAHLRAVL
jgi:hypothetical protein